MKALSGTFAFGALAVIAIVTLPSCCRKEVTDQRFFLKFGTETEYVDLTKPDFDKALCTLKANGGQYEVRFLADPRATPIPDYNPSCSPVSINTDKVTTSGAARTEPAEESSAYDPKATYRVYSNNATDIENVLKTFKSPTPPPSH
jgi:hypothetical protein